MFRKKNRNHTGKIKYAYSRTPNAQRLGAKRRKKKNAFNVDSGKKRKIKIYLILVIMLAGFSYLAYFLFFSNYFNLKEIYEIQENVKKENKNFEKYFKDLKGKNLIFINTSEIQAKITEENTQFEKIDVKKIYPNKIQIETSKYPIIANVINLIGDSQKKYIINKAGLSVQRETENPNLPYIKITTEEPLDPANPLLEKDKLEYIIGAIGFYEEKIGMKVFDAEFLKKAREVHLKTEKYFYVWLDSEKSYEEQILKLKKIAPKLDIRNTELSYIDLRIAGISGDKIIYKKR